MQKKRIFIGILADENIKKNVSLWQKKFLTNTKIRRISASNLHVTLIPPWYEENIDKISEKLKSIQNLIGPFKIIFDKVEIGPKGKSPRLIWISGKTPSELLKIQTLLRDTLGFKLERPFLTHMTIARFNPKKVKLKKQVFSPISWSFKVNKVYLLESKLFPDGAEYSPLSEFII